MYRRSYFRRGGSKYSNETICVNHQVKSEIAGQTPLTSQPITIIPPTNVLGNRKVKNFTLRFTSFFCNSPVYGVLAYVPDGTDMRAPLVSGNSQSLYEPNQNVIATFIIPPSCTRDNQSQVVDVLSNPPIVVSTRLARNLNTGDRICLALVSPVTTVAGDGEDSNPPAALITGTINFSIKY